MLDVKKVIDCKGSEIVQAVEQEIISSVLYGRTSKGVKIYIDSEGVISKVDAPNADWSSCYIEHEITYLDKDFYKRVSLGNIQEELTREELAKVVAKYSMDEEIDYKEAFDELVGSNSWEDVKYYSSEVFNRVAKDKAQAFIKTLDLIINTEGKIIL